MLDQPTLVLNRSWVAMTTTTVQSALSLAYRDVARLIQPETFQTHDFQSWIDLKVPDHETGIGMVKRKIRVPEVIILTRHNRMPERHVPFSRRSLYRRDGNRCQYCGKRFGTEDLSIDHVVPRALGGRTSWDNCVLACIQCNARKGSRTPSEAGMKLLRRVRAPRWSPCLAISRQRRLASWEQFISEQYWNVTLDDEGRDDFEP